VKSFLAVVLLGLSPLIAIADEGPVMFRVTVKEGGRVIASPSFLANVGQSATIRLSDSLSIEALPKAAESDGRAWTQIRIKYFETPDSKFVQEMQMRHPVAMRTGSFEYTDPANRRYVVAIGR
jgi:hypothetical protein